MTKEDGLDLYGMVEYDVRAEMEKGSYFQIYIDYRTWCNRLGRDPVAPTKFGKKEAFQHLKNVRGNVIKDSAHKEAKKFLAMKKMNITNLQFGENVASEEMLIIGEKMKRNKRKQIEDVLGKRDCAPRKAIDWVANNLGRRNPDPEECPSWFAWQCLDLYGKNMDTQLDFHKTFLAKMLPSKAQMELEDKIKDNSDEVDQDIVAIKQKLTDESVLQTGSEGDNGELAVSSKSA